MFNFPLQQRNLKQKFIALLKRFRVSEELEHDQEEIDQKLSGWCDRYLFTSITRFVYIKQSILAIPLKFHAIAIRDIIISAY